MVRGIVYLMSSVVDGLIKIGISNIDSYQDRMRFLENNGYKNICGLKRRFAIEVEDYAEKEKLLQSVFSKSRIGDSELFSLDINLAIQLLSAFEGKIIFPEEASKEEIFIEATETVNEEADEANLRKPKFPFKEIQFSSSLTHKNYYTRMNEMNKLGIYDEETNEEIPNYSCPSKKQIVKQAVLDLEKGHVPSNINELTLYQLVHRLEKLLGKYYPPYFN